MSIGFVNNTIYIPQSYINNIPNSYQYSLNCKECICHALTSNINYSLINCIIDIKLCFYYLNINLTNSFYFNMDSFIYLSTNIFTFSPPPPPPPTTTTTTSMTSKQSTYVYPLTTIHTTSIISSMSTCNGPLLITFDNIVNATKTDSAIPNYYNCFKWINGWYINTTTASLSSGYLTVLSSGIYVGLNRNGTSMNMTTITSFFNLYSFFASAAYQNSLTIFIQGIHSNNSIIYQKKIILYYYLKTNITLNWFNLTTLNIQSYYYDSSTNINYTGLGYQFTFDNIYLNLF